MSNQSPKQTQGISFTVIILSSVIACILGIFFAKHWQTASQGQSPLGGYVFKGTVLKTPRAVSHFNLTSTDNKAFDNESLKGHWTFVFFGFTSCPQMCPTAMRELALTYNLLKQDKVQPLPQVLMISVDPQRDSLSKMKSYVEGFNSDFIGAIGSDKQVRVLSNEMGIAYEKVAMKGKSDENYDIQHSGAIIVLNPQGAIKAFFNWPHKPSEMAQDYAKLVS